MAREKMTKKEILVLEDLLGSNKKIAAEIREKLRQKGILTASLSSMLLAPCLT